MSKRASRQRLTRAGKGMAGSGGCRRQLLSAPFLELLREGTILTGGVVLQAVVLVNLEQALLLEEALLEKIAALAFAKKPQRGPAHLLIVQRGRQFLVFLPELRRFRHQQRIGDIRQNLL